MKLLFALMLAAGILTPAIAAPAVPMVAQKPNAAFDRWADKFAEDWIRQSPEQASVVQYFSGAAQDAVDSTLSPRTEENSKQRVALARVGVKALDRWLAGPLDATERVSAQTMRWQLANVIAAEAYQEHNFAFDQFRGMQVSAVSFLSQQHPVRRAADVAHYQARLEQLATRMDEAIARARAATAKGLIPPRFILEKSQAQVDNFMKPAAAGNVLVTSLDERMAKLTDMTPEQRRVAVGRAALTVDRSILPAWGRLKAFLAELHPKTGNIAGLSRLPNGDKAYSVFLASNTGTSLNAEQIHAIGLREVARIEAEMDKHLKSLGFSEGGIEQRMRQMDKARQPAASPDPRPEILARYTAMVRDAEKRSAALFNLKPKAPVEVRREPALTEATAAAHYSVPAPDGTLPGVFWVPLRGPDFNISRMRSLSYHEAVPGHHFQLALMQEQTQLPKFRSSRVFGGGSAHSEGWALYAERLAVENGWYKDDVEGLLGALGSELFRARRLVVDTGLHAKGWTREQGIAYGIDATEVERYVVMPGQACAYMIGMLRILELRDKARAALGDKFSLPAFHDVILRTGSVPLDVMSQNVDEWIAAQKH